MPARHMVEGRGEGEGGSRGTHVRADGVLVLIALVLVVGGNRRGGTEGRCWLDLGRRYHHGERAPVATPRPTPAGVVRGHSKALLGRVGREGARESKCKGKVLKGFRRSVEDKGRRGGLPAS